MFRNLYILNNYVKNLANLMLHMKLTAGNDFLTSVTTLVGMPPQHSQTIRNRKKYRTFPQKSAVSLRSMRL